MKITNMLGLSSADEIEAAPPKPRAGSAVPSFAESVVHKGAEDALDAITKVMGFQVGARDEFLKTPEGAALRNVLRRFVMHGNALSMEVEK
jgi:hypothetical protein